MKATLFYISYFAATLAIPRTEPKTQLERLYDHPESRIINGNEVTPHSIPYQVHLLILSIGIGGWTCSGSLISPKYILTSAHCLVDGAGAIIHLGVHNIDQSEPHKVMMESKNLIPHEDYDPETITNDIGLIVLEEDVRLNDYIDVVMLPSKNTSSTDYEGVNARFSGWGIVSSEGNSTSVLLEANSTVISNNQCRQVYTNIIDTHICTLGTQDEGICNGDTGGPLVTDNVQIGVISFGSRGCRGELPSVFTRITSYLDWLEEHTDLKF